MAVLVGSGGACRAGLIVGAGLGFSRCFGGLGWEAQFRDAALVGNGEL
jgi:hypothetical protein